VLDFGLAKLTDKVEAGEREFTETMRQNDAPATSSLLDPNEQEHSQNFRSDTVGTTFMLVRECPRLVLSSYSSILASRLRLAYSSYSKRMIDDPRCKIAIQCLPFRTRSPCLRISCGCKFGIDIEQVGRFLTLCRWRPLFAAAEVRLRLIHWSGKPAKPSPSPRPDNLMQSRRL
jgi:hypothetical protein